MGMYRTYFSRICCLVFSLFFLCEYLIYYLVLVQCSWPILDPQKADKTIEIREPTEALKVMVLADPHLLGPRRGHWFDKLRREWQMYRAFQTAMTLQKPDVVFILGDLFDEGQSVSEHEFNTYVDRFHSIFQVPEGTKLFVAVGNHDIGFHYRITPYLQQRFTDAFDAPSVRLISLAGSHFVIINSMAMEGDGCFVCRPAELLLSKIANLASDDCGACTAASHPIDTNNYTANSGDLRSLPSTFQVDSSKIAAAIAEQIGGSTSAAQVKGLPNAHFPMYRESDEDCHEPDEAPEDEKNQKFRERWECLSRESTLSMLDMLQPRVVIGGHTHHGCHRFFASTKTHEYTVPSFSWRNKNNPSYSLAIFSPNNYEVSKCYMPEESTVEFLYFAGVIGILAYSVLAYKAVCRRHRLFKEMVEKKKIP